MKSHIRLSAEHPVKRVITCGPPERAELISKFLTHPKVLAKNREYHSFSGTFDGQEILVISHGIGAPGAAICFRELIDIGTKVMVRIGTAGSLQERFKIGDIVVANEAYRLDGVTHQMVKSEVRALADQKLADRLVASLKPSFGKVEAGPVLTCDLFYQESLPVEWQKYHELGALAVEMECSPLFILGSLHKIKTAAVLGLDGSPLKWEQGDYDPRSKSLENNIQQAIPIILNHIAAEAIE